MDLNEIVVFARVVQAGSFSTAARSLGMPKSTVSRRVSELEARVGARLLQRTTRKLGLTDAGRTYYEHAARIVAEIEEAEQAVGRMQAAPRGLLRVTAPLSFTMLGPVLSEYLRRHPEVTIELICTDRQVDLVEERFDVAIRAGQLNDSTLVARPVGSIRWALVAAPTYCDAHGRPETPAELVKHACIVFGAVASPTLWVLRAGGKSVEVRVKPRMVVNDFEIMREAVRDGLGVASMPEFVCAEDLHSGRLQRVLPEWGSTEIPVNAIYPTARHLSPKVAAFIELLREQLRLRA